MDDFFKYLYENSGGYICIAFAIWLSLKQGIKIAINKCILPITNRHIKFLDDVTLTMSEFNKTLHNIILEQQKLRSEIGNIDNKVTDFKVDITNKINSLQTDLKEISREQIRQFNDNTDKNKRKP